MKRTRRDPQQLLQHSSWRVADPQADNHKLSFPNLCGNTHTHTERERTASVARVYITADQCSVCPCCSKLSPIWTRICPLVLIISPRPARTRTHTLTHTRWLTVFPPRVGLFPPLAPRALRHDQLPHCRAWIRRSAWTQTQGEPLPLAAHQPRTHTHTHTDSSEREPRSCI